MGGQGVPAAPLTAEGEVAKGTLIGSLTSAVRPAEAEFGLGPSRVGPQTSRPLGASFLVSEYGLKTVQNLKSSFAILRINFLMLDSVRDLANFWQS